MQLPQCGPTFRQDYVGRNVGVLLDLYWITRVLFIENLLQFGQLSLGKLTKSELVSLISGNSIENQIHRTGGL